MTSPAILDEIEGRLINFREILVNLPGQLAGIGRNQSVFSKHSRREIPGVFGIEGIADDDFSGPVGSALLEVVSIGNAIIVVASTTGPLGTIRDFAVGGKRGPVKSSHDDLLVFANLRRSRDR